MIDLQLHSGVEECVEEVKVQVEVKCAKRYYIELHFDVEECR